MTDERAGPAFNEANIERALIEAQGDLFVAAQLLGHVTVLKLDRAIRAPSACRDVSSPSSR
jgi:hypothetical protein